MLGYIITMQLLLVMFLLHFTFIYPLFYQQTTSLTCQECPEIVEEKTINTSVVYLDNSVKVRGKITIAIICWRHLENARNETIICDTHMR